MNSSSANLILVDWDADEPVYVQIANQIRVRIASGKLPPGSRLPPLRSIASDLGVNLNTVARAYRILEEEGFLTIRVRSGAVVAPPAREADGEAISNLHEELGTVLARMRQAGLEMGELRLRIERELDNLQAGNTRQKRRDR